MQKGAANALREGYLIKAGGKTHVKNWQQRWFVLNGFSLSYFRSKSDSYAAGVVSLKGSRLRLERPSKYDKENCFSITTATDNRTYVLVADTPFDMIEWATVARRMCKE